MFIAKDLKCLLQEKRKKIFTLIINLFFIVVFEQVFLLVLYTKNTFKK